MSGLTFCNTSGAFHGSLGHKRSPSIKRRKHNHTGSWMCESSESSTPHAPRHKRPASVSSPNHDFGRRHSHTDKGKAITKSLEEPVVDENSPPGCRLLPVTVQQLPVKEAWTESPKIIQPFRRTFGRQAPQGVPLLDLSSLNEPDDDLQPVQLLELSDVNTQRSLISWGGHDHWLSPPSCHMTAHNHHVTAPGPTSDLAVEAEMNVEEKTLTREKTPSVDKLPQAKGLESNQLQFIETKLMSHERAKPALVGSSPQPPLPFPGAHPQPFSGVAVPEASISKRLRFEARILTQHGRDVHRELCGFFFLADNSITVYEYRQFGKKSSALPLIQRGCYTHLIGYRKGKPLEINFIKKGSVIHFRSSDHPGLPNTLRTRPLVALMITGVDEKTKKQLLCEGRNPVEHHTIEAYLSTPLPPDEEKDRLMLSTLQGMLCSRLKGRATKTLVGVGRELRRLSSDEGVISRAHLQQTLRNYHLSLTLEDMDLLYQLLVSIEMAPPTDLGLYVDGCVCALVGRMSEDRLALIRKLFHRLDAHKNGTVSVEHVDKFFNQSCRITIGKVQRSTADVWEDILECLFGTTTTIVYADLEHYYLGVSIETTSDSEFYSLIRHCWSL